MAIRTVRAGEFAEFLAFLEAGMRPDGATTRVQDDFPVALAPDNLEGLWGVRDRQGWAAGLAVLVRELVTSQGPVNVAGIGSVVTRPDRRGEGLSGRLQASVLGRLAARGVPLAVLWTDRPEVYAGRGFQPAGWEYHLDLAAADLGDLAPLARRARPFESADLVAVALLHGQHELRSRREPGDAERLYGMPGTTGLVMAGDGEVQAYAFCGKGTDFPGYVAEWGGRPELALAVIAAARERGLATRVLVPAGGEALLEAAKRRGAQAELWPCGLWSVLRPDLLPGAAMRRDPAAARDAREWLGGPGPDGRPWEGRLRVAVWGLDSV